MKILATTVLTCVLALAPLPLVAHHSAAAMDFQNTIEMEGVVQRIEVVNPHLKLVLRVTDEKGTRDIEFEGHSRNNVYRSGWRDGMLEFGATITVRIAPMRDGNDGGYVTAFRTADGQEVGFQ
jgi:hypothetical protein